MAITANRLLEATRVLLGFVGRFRTALSFRGAKLLGVITVLQCGVFSAVVKSYCKCPQQINKCEELRDTRAATFYCTTLVCHSVPKHK